MDIVPSIIFLITPLTASNFAAELFTGNLTMSRAKMHLYKNVATVRKCHERSITLLQTSPRTKGMLKNLSRPEFYEQKLLPIMQHEYISIPFYCSELGQILLPPLYIYWRSGLI